MRHALGVRVQERWPGRVRQRAAIFGAVGAVLLIPPIWELIVVGARVAPIMGVDYQLYIDATARWLGGGPFYDWYELAGAFGPTDHAVLYAPTAILLFAPFTVLPAALWWAIPLGIVAAVTAHLRPDPIVWPFLAICLAWPATSLTIVVGNPVLWGAAALALATIHRWPAALFVIKPTLLPFALFGVWRRSWWLALGVVVVLSLPFGSLWNDWLTVIQNARVGGVFRSLDQVPILLFPLIVWLGQTRPDPIPEPRQIAMVRADLEPAHAQG